MQKRKPSVLRETVTSIAGIASGVWLGYTALSQKLPVPPPSPTAGRPLALSPCRDGYFEGQIFGASPVELHWKGQDLDCAGNSRPDGRGVRLFFGGKVNGGENRLVFVLGVGMSIGKLSAGEHPASVTLIDEASSIFFHGPPGRCFTRIHEVSPLSRPGSYRVQGEIYCAGALASVSGEHSVTLGDIRYAGSLEIGEL